MASEPETLRDLTRIEARVLAVLVEKQHTVPDTYPLSLNALVAGCNQKTARVPVMEVSDADVLAALDALKSLSLVFEGGGSRVVKFEHNLGRVLGVPSQSVALLTVLILRGPQTAAELRLNCDRLHRFADVSSVEGFLDELASKEPVRVLKLPRGAGAREARWAHVLCGAAGIPAVAADTAGGGREPVDGDELAAVRAEQARLSGEVAALRTLVQRLARELGVDGG